MIFSHLMFLSLSLSPFEINKNTLKRKNKRKKSHSNLATTVFIGLIMITEGEESELLEAKPFV